MAKEKKVKEAKPRPEKHERSDLESSGSFDEAMSVFFKKPVPKKEQK